MQPERPAGSAAVPRPPLQHTSPILQLLEELGRFQIQVPGRGAVLGGGVGGVASCHLLSQLRASVRSCWVLAPLPVFDLGLTSSCKCVPFAQGTAAWGIICQEMIHLSCVFGVLL